MEEGVLPEAWEAWLVREGLEGSGTALVQKGRNAEFFLSL